MRERSPWIGALLLVLLGGCTKPDHSGRSATTLLIVDVTAAIASEEQEVPTVQKTARLQSRVDHVLVAESAGVVRMRVAKEGGPIAEGEPVLALDDEVERSECDAATSHWVHLALEGASPATREQARSQASRAREALRQRRVTAPASGVLDRYFVKAGDYVARGMPVARLVDPERLYFIVSVLDEHILWVPDAALVTFRVGAHGARTFAGKVVRKGQAAVKETGLFEVEVEIEATPDLRPGFLALAQIPLGGTAGVLTIPREATFERHGTTRVFAIANTEENPTAEEREITVRAFPSRPDLLTALSGIRLGERVVVRGRLGVSNGQRVRIVP